MLTCYSELLGEKCAIGTKTVQALHHDGGNVWTVAGSDDEENPEEIEWFKFEQIEVPDGSGGFRMGQRLTVCGAENLYSVENENLQEPLWSMRKAKNEMRIKSWENDWEMLLRKKAD